MNSLVAVMATIGGLSWIGVAINAIAQRRTVRATEQKTDAETDAITVGTALEALRGVRAEARELRVELNEARAEMAALRRHLQLVEELLRHNGIPVPEFVWPAPSTNGRGKDR